MASNGRDKMLEVPLTEHEIINLLEAADVLKVSLVEVLQRLAALVEVESDGRLSLAEQVASAGEEAR